MTEPRKSERPRPAFIRKARVEDCSDIARFFLISSDGLAAYIWDQSRDPGTPLLAHGTARYARRDTAFSFENCLIAERGGSTVGMLHAFPMPASDPAERESTESGPAERESNERETDPVLQPYAELEDPGSLYISGIAVDDDYRSLGIGAALMDAAENLARERSIPRISLICFEENRRAVAFYIKRGFEITGSRPITPHPTLHYTTGKAMLMIKELRT